METVGGGSQNLHPPRYRGTPKKFSGGEFFRYLGEGL